MHFYLFKRGHTHSENVGVDKREASGHGEVGCGAQRCHVTQFFDEGEKDEEGKKKEHIHSLVQPQCCGNNRSSTPF